MGMGRMRRSEGVVVRCSLGLEIYRWYIRGDSRSDGVYGFQDLDELRVISI